MQDLASIKLWRYFHNKRWKQPVYPQTLEFGGRYFGVYCSQKTDIVVKEIPNDMLNS
jgi:hypothetical protein